MQHPKNPPVFPLCKGGRLKLFCRQRVNFDQAAAELAGNIAGELQRIGRLPVRFPPGRPLEDVPKSSVGLRDGAHAEGSAVFIVLGDGRELQRTRSLRPGDREVLRVGVAGVGRLELCTEGSEGHNHNSWAIWVGPEVSR